MLEFYSFLQAKPGEIKFGGGSPALEIHSALLFTKRCFGILLPAAQDFLPLLGAYTEKKPPKLKIAFLM